MLWSCLARLLLTAFGWTWQPPPTFPPRTVVLWLTLSDWDAILGGLYYTAYSTFRQRFYLCSNLAELATVTTSRHLSAVISIGDDIPTQIDEVLQTKPTGVTVLSWDYAHHRPHWSRIHLNPRPLTLMADLMHPQPFRSPLDLIDSQWVIEWLIALTLFWWNWWVPFLYSLELHWTYTTKLTPFQWRCRLGSLALMALSLAPLLTQCRTLIGLGFIWAVSASPLLWRISSWFVLLRAL